MVVLGVLLDVFGLRLLMIVVGTIFPLLSYFLHKMEKVEMNYPLEVRVVSVEVESEE